MKIVARVTTTVIIESPHQIPEAGQRSIVAGFETGWRFGAAKDAAMMAEILRQQYKDGALRMSISDVFVDATLEESRQP